MKKYLVCLLLVSGMTFASSVSENLKYIILKNYLSESVEPLYQMMAAQAVGATDKKIEPDTLIEQFKQKFQSEEVLEKLAEPYRKHFSEKEIGELKEIFASSVWDKYIKEGTTIAQGHMSVIQSLFQDLVEKIEAETRPSLADSGVLEITKENRSQLSESDKPIILDVSADWCGPCKAMEPIFSDLSEKYGDSIQFAKINFDQEQELANDLDVKSLPTILFIKPGEKTASIKNVGFLNKDDFEKKIGEFLKTIE